MVVERVAGKKVLLALWGEGLRADLWGKVMTVVVAATAKVA